MSSSASLPLHQSIHQHHHLSPLPLHSPALQRDPEQITTFKTHATLHSLTYPLQVVLLRLELVKLLSPWTLDLIPHITLSLLLLLWECHFHHLHLLLPQGEGSILCHTTTSRDGCGLSASSSSTHCPVNFPSPSPSTCNFISITCTMINNSIMHITFCSYVHCDVIAAIMKLYTCMLS